MTGANHVRKPGKQHTTKRFTPEQLEEKLRQARLMLSLGRKLHLISKDLDVGYTWLRGQINPTNRYRSPNPPGFRLHRVENGGARRRREEAIPAVPEDTRDFNARFNGDPLPGRSALDRKLAEKKRSVEHEAGRLQSVDEGRGRDGAGIRGDSELVRVRGGGGGAAAESNGAGRADAVQLPEPDRGEGARDGVGLGPARGRGDSCAGGDGGAHRVNDRGATAGPEPERGDREDASPGGGEPDARVGTNSRDAQGDATRSLRGEG